MASTMSWLTTEIKMMMHNEGSQIAKIVMNGCNMGIQSIGENLTKYKTASEEAKKLIDVTRESFFKGISVIGDNTRIGDIGNAIQSYVESNGFSVVKEYIGHGIGKNLHEDPEVPNYGNAGRGQRIRPGMTIAIEPMVNVGDWQVRVLSDKWTVVTKDGSLSAHYENTVAITDNGVLILTDPS